MRLPLKDKETKEIDMDQVKLMVDTYMKAWLNYFDTAYMYHDGKSELYFKEAVYDRYPRDSYILADKFPMWSVNEQADVERIFNEQLSKTGVAHFDLYLLHAVGKDVAEKAEKFGVFDYLRKQKEQGRIRHLGFSFHDSPEFLDEFLTKHPFLEFVQLQVNYFDWVDETLAKELCEVAAMHQKPIIVMEPVKGGTLANPPEEAKALIEKAYPGKSCASLALRYAESLPNLVTVLSGMSSIEQMEDNLKTTLGFEQVTEKDQPLLDEVVAILKKAAEIPCTDCKYCKDCPVSINIPGNFSNYNNYRRSLDLEVGKDGYKKLNPSDEAANCIACGQCESICPQHIKIIDNMKKVVKRFA
jgi:predicted aldo/keto reductase-like oxidoreductase